MVELGAVLLVCFVFTLVVCCLNWKPESIPNVTLYSVCSGHLRCLGLHPTAQRGKPWGSDTHATPVHPCVSDADENHLLLSYPSWIPSWNAITRVWPSTKFPCLLQRWGSYDPPVPRDITQDASIARPQIKLQAIALKGLCMIRHITQRWKPHPLDPDSGSLVLCDLGDLLNLSFSSVSCLPDPFCLKS